MFARAVYRPLLLTAAVAAGSCGAALAAGPATERTGLDFRIDNDGLSLGKEDKDYTGGLSLTLTGPHATGHVLSLDPALGYLDTALGVTPTAADTTVHGFGIGLMAFTPEDITTTGPLPDDRPYASLLYISNTRQHLRLEAGTSVVTTLTLGLLGTKFPGELQDAFHGVTHSKRARGWNNQISHGGEPTFRYRIALQDMPWSHMPRRGPGFDIKTAVQASLGYVTEVAWSLSGRWGQVRSPWWTFNPQLALYGETWAPAAFRDAYAAQNDFYWLGGITLHLRAYNALLQGQSRDNPVELDGDALNAAIGEAWTGVTMGFRNGLRLSYILRGQTSDIDTGTADRNPVWGTLTLGYIF